MTDNDKREPVEYPFDRMRSATAKRLTQSVTTKPRVTLHSFADLTALLRVKRGQAALTASSITVLLARLLACHLAIDSRLNGWVREEKLIISRTVNLGVAIQTERGLVTPVIPLADELSFAEFKAAFDDNVERARAGKLHPRDFADGSFTISSLGGHRVQGFTPVINPPQIAILGVGQYSTVPRPDGDGGWQAVDELPLSLTFDHSAVDGEPAAAWLDGLLAAVERPDEGLFA